MTQALKINRILDLVTLTAAQVGQLTVEMAEVKEELAKKADKADLVNMAEKSDLLGKADKADLTALAEKSDVSSIAQGLKDLESTMNYKFAVIMTELDQKPNRDELEFFINSVNENDSVYVQMLLDHDRSIKKLEKLSKV